MIEESESERESERGKARERGREAGAENRVGGWSGEKGSVVEQWGCLSCGYADSFALRSTAPYSFTVRAFRALALYLLRVWST